MITNKPITLAIDDLTQARELNYHCRWSSDPITTERLNKVIASDPYAAKKSITRSYLLLVAVLLFAVFGSLFVMAMVAK